MLYVPTTKNWNIKKYNIVHFSNLVKIQKTCFLFLCMQKSTYPQPTNLTTPTFPPLIHNQIFHSSTDHHQLIHNVIHNLFSYPQTYPQATHTTKLIHSFHNFIHRYKKVIHRLNSITYKYMKNQSYDYYNHITYIIYEPLVI